MRHPPAMLDFRQIFFFLDLFGIISVAIYSPLVNIKTNCTVKSLYRLADTHFPHSVGVFEMHCRPPTRVAKWEISQLSCDITPRHAQLWSYPLRILSPPSLGRITVQHDKHNVMYFLFYLYYVGHLNVDFKCSYTHEYIAAVTNL